MILNWAKTSAYKPSIVLAARAVLRHRVYRRYPGNERAAVWRHRGYSQETYSKAVAWRHRCCAEKTPPPLTAAQRVFCRELFSGRCLAKLRCATQQLADMSQYICAARSKAWSVFLHSNAGIVGSNLTRVMNVCVRLFCVCVILRVGSDLATGWSPFQGLKLTVYRIMKLKK
jgi:hypothetical protein